MITAGQYNNAQGMENNEKNERIQARLYMFYTEQFL